MRKILSLVIFACAINSIFCGRLFAATPNKISYQGILKEKGIFVSATKVMKFSIFNALTGGTEVWTTGNVSVEVDQGVFRYILEPAAITGWETETYFLQTTIEGTVLTPREELVSSVYALQAKNVDDGSIATSKIVNGAVTSAKIAAGAVGPAQVAVNQFYDIIVASASNAVSTITGGDYFNDVKVSSALYADSAAIGSGDYFNDVKVSSAIYADSADNLLSGSNHFNDVKVSSALYADSAAIGSGDYFNDVKVSSAIYADTANNLLTGSTHFNDVKVSSALYADSAGIPDNMVTTDTNQTISGAKTFTSSVTINASMAIKKADVTCIGGVNGDVDIGDATFVKLVGPAAPYNLTGFTGGYDGRLLIVYNSVGYALTLQENVGAVAENGIYLLGSAATTAEGAYTLIYDSSVSRWIVVSAQP